MINKKLYKIGTLGKPHSLKGYLYINYEIFFRNFNFKNKKVYINSKEYEIEEIKKHLKNRFLIKFLKTDSIESAEKLRNYKVFISIEEIDQYLDNGLPWPGFYLNEVLNDDIKILSYFYSDKYIYCNVMDKEEIVIPYNDHYFAYENKKLILKNKLVN